MDQVLEYLFILKDVIVIVHSVLIRKHGILKEERLFTSELEDVLIKLINKPPYCRIHTFRWRTF